MLYKEKLNIFLAKRTIENLWMGRFLPQGIFALEPVFPLPLYEKGMVVYSVFHAHWKLDENSRPSWKYAC